MDSEQKTLFVTLWSILVAEWAGLLILIYYARLPHFIALFVAFVQLISPWLLAANLVFFIFTLYTREVEFTWVFWKNYLIELWRFFLRSLLIGLAAIAASALLGAGLGISADAVSRSPTVRSMQEWVNVHFIN